MTIVEIGPSYLPMLLFSEVTRKKVQSGAIYVGIDLDHEALLQLRKREKVRNDEKIYTVVGDLGEIPLQDGTADEIWIQNVLGGTLKNRPYILPDGTERYELGWGRYFTELSRILKPEGKLFISEWAPK